MLKDQTADIKIALVLKVMQSHYRPGQVVSVPVPGVEAPRFLDNRHMKVVRLSALSTGRFYPQETFLSRPQGHVNEKSQ
jgi:hypothetical protein